MSKSNEQFTPEPLTASQYEKYVGQLVSELEFAHGGSVFLNRRFPGKRQPGNYEVDVALEVQLAEAIRFLLIVECKNWKRPVDRPVIQKMAQTRDAISADKAAIASPVGFTAEARKVAETLEIALWTISITEWVIHNSACLPCDSFSEEMFYADTNRNWINNPLSIKIVEHWEPRVIPLRNLPEPIDWVRFYISHVHHCDVPRDIHYLISEKLGQHNSAVEI